MNHPQNSEPWPEIPWYVPDWVLDGAAPPAPPVGLRRPDAPMQFSDGAAHDGHGAADGAGPGGPGSMTGAAGVSDDDDELPLDVWRRLAADARFDLHRSGPEGRDGYGPQGEADGSAEPGPDPAVEPVTRPVGSGSRRGHREPPAARRRRNRADGSSSRRQPARTWPALRRYPLAILITDTLVLVVLLSWLIGHPTAESFLVTGLGFTAGILCGQLHAPCRRSRHLPISAQRRPPETERTRHRERGPTWRRRGIPGHPIPGPEAGSGSP